MIQSSERDWPEDFPGENGNYSNKCVSCGLLFVGHKRHHVCKVCAEQQKARYEAMTPEEKAAHWAKVQEAIDEWSRRPPQK